MWAPTSHTCFENLLLLSMGQLYFIVHNAPLNGKGGPPLNGRFVANNLKETS